MSSPHNRNTIYHAGNVIFKSKDGGIKWEVISPDLTRNNKIQQVPGGTPFTNEAAGGENYNTLMSLSLSPHDSKVIWAGSDDGLIHITQDGGENWKNVTPRGLKEGIINSIEVSPHDPATAYITLMRYKFMDLMPYIFKTKDYGLNWELITNGIKGVHTFARVVRADPKVPGILYAGTETGFYISYDEGENWESFQNNLPIVPINDLFIRDNDLIAATAGRSFWILDDISPLQEQKNINGLHLVTPKKGYRIFSRKTSKNSFQGTNPLSGIILDYYLPEVSDSLNITLEIIDGDEVIRTYSSVKEKSNKSWPGGPSLKEILPKNQGFNRFHWDLRREFLPSVEKVFVYGSYSGSRVSPGNYKAKLKVNEKEKVVEINVLPNPNLSISKSDFDKQQDLLVKIENSIRDVHESVTNMREVQKQLKYYQQYLSKNQSYEALISKANYIEEKLKSWEVNLIQPNQKTFQDVINFHNKLNAEWMYLKEYVDSEDPKVTQGAEIRHNDLNNKWQEYKIQLQEIIDKDFKDFETEFKSKNIPALIYK